MLCRVVGRRGSSCLLYVGGRGTVRDATPLGGRRTTSGRAKRRVARRRCGLAGRRPCAEWPRDEGCLATSTCGRNGSEMARRTRVPKVGACVLAAIAALLLWAT